MTTTDNYEEDLPFKPNWVSKPGETIKDILVDRYIDPEDFAFRMGMSGDEAEALISAETRIDEEVACTLSSVLGASAQFWLNREKHYREGLIRIVNADRERHLSNAHD